MKTYKKIIFSGLITALLIAIVGCSEDDSTTSVGTNEPPSITSVSLSINDSLTTVGFRSNTYNIRGNGFSGIENIYFNGYDTYFNPTYVTNNVIIVVVDEDTPFDLENEYIEVVTFGGSATYDFDIAPPQPEVHSINPVNVDAGGTFTIYGNYFVDSTVKVGDIDAEIVSVEENEMVIQMPEDAQYEYVSVTNPSGTTEWTGAAIGTAFYDDVFYNGWDVESWNGHEFVSDDLEGAFQGTAFFKKTMAAFGNIQFNWGWHDVSAFTGIKFSVRSDNPGSLVFIPNGGTWGNGDWAVPTDVGWQEYTFTIEEIQGFLLENGTILQNISFQEFSGKDNTYYFDNFVYTID